MQLRFNQSNNMSNVRTPREQSTKDKYMANLYAQYTEHLLLEPPTWIGDSELANRLMNDVHVPAVCHDAARKAAGMVYANWKSKLDTLQSELASALNAKP